VPELDEHLRPTGSTRPDDGTLFNPGFGTTRFAFFGAPKVPIWYAASGPEAAVFESLLHDKVPGGSVPRAEWGTRMLSVVETTRPMRLAKFHSDGLRRFNLTAADLTDTPPTTYSQTVAWAHEAWKAGYDGCAWVSKQYNSQVAYALFGSVTHGADAPPMNLRAIPDSAETRVFINPADFEWLAGICASMHVTTTR